MCPNPLRFWRPPARGCESRPRCHRTPIRIAGACSPSPPHRLAAAPQDARTSAVSSRVTADAWSARGLSFADFQAGGGAFAPPEWPCSPGSLHPFLQGKRRACSPRTIARLRLRRQPRRWWVDQFSRVARGVTEGARFGETPRFWSGGNSRRARSAELLSSRLGELETQRGDARAGHGRTGVRLGAGPDASDCLSPERCRARDRACWYAGEENAVDPAPIPQRCRAASRIQTHDKPRRRA